MRTACERLCVRISGTGQKYACLGSLSRVLTPRSEAARRTRNLTCDGDTSRDRQSHPHSISQTDERDRSALADRLQMRSPACVQRLGTPPLAAHTPPSPPRWTHHGRRRRVCASHHRRDGARSSWGGDAEHVRTPSWPARALESAHSRSAQTDGRDDCATRRRDLLGKNS